VLITWIINKREKKPKKDLNRDFHDYQDCHDLLF